MSTAERRAREKAQRRREILDAARQEFFERGFHTPTVDDVAARAEVSKGTIYLYFESKEEILAHLLLEGLDLLLAEMEAVYDADSPPPAEAGLQALAHAYLDFCQNNPNYFRLIMAFDRGRFEESISRELYKEVLNRSLHGLALVKQTIEMGTATGVFHVEDPWQAAGLVWAALNGVLVLMAHPLRQRLAAERSQDDVPGHAGLGRKRPRGRSQPDLEGGERMKKVVIVGGVRTPIGSHGGAFRTLTAQHLASLVFREVVERVGIDPLLFDDVILGCIGQQSDAPNIGRVAGLLAGVPVNVPGYTVQRNCVSGMVSITSAYQAIQAGDGEVFSVRRRREHEHLALRGARRALGSEAAPRHLCGHALGRS